MKNWYTLEPDRYNLINTHYTPGRDGHRIRHVTLHHMGGIMNVDGCVETWRQRPASAHYCIDPYGEIGQAVNDWDTAWANRNLVSNLETIAIEHSDCGGPEQDWPISAATLEAGAHLVAAICLAYDLGRPEAGKNIKYHSVESAGYTDCPWHLRPGHKYHDGYVRRAQWWYDEMLKHKDDPQDAVETENTMANFGPDQVGALDEAKKYAADARAQLTGTKQLGQYPGWAQLGGRTVVDALGVIGAKLEIPGFYDTKEVK